MAGSGRPVFRTGHYDADGTLVRASEAFPVEQPGDPQTVADVCARAADTGCTYEAGTFLVWVDRDLEPARRIEQNPQPDGVRAYGGQHPTVPAYQWRRRADSSTLLILAAQPRRSNR
jgi:hypothetical protein